ncbi:MAG: DUF2384 domain-containing protein, partial [Cellvibrionaceae bacterium]|nr:DUF2384 domain-containing protein [Cellvibrionaceae bacterium]
MAINPSTKAFRPREKQPDYWRRLGLPGRGPRLFTLLEKGFSYRVYDDLAQQAGLEKQQLAEVLSISPATLARRAKAGQFSTAESDRLYRLAEIFKTAIDLFDGDEARARSWFARPNKGLGDKSPLQMMRSATEAEAVDELIGRLEHGVIG